MRVVSHPEADQELEAAALWYDERQPGLGDDLLDEFEQTPRRVLGEPERRRKVRGDNRKLNFRRFPYWSGSVLRIDRTSRFMALKLRRPLAEKSG